MRLLAGLESLKMLPRQSAVSIGNFDGVHLGHQKLIAHARSHGLPVALITFEPHPLTVLRPALAPPRLTRADEKRKLFDNLGVDWLVELPPEPAVLNLTAREFWDRFLQDAQPARVIEGDSFTFGKGRGGDVNQLKIWSAECGVALEVIESEKAPLLDMLLAPVSSSLIRWLLANGRVRDAAICLGRPYPLTGLVVRGFERGRTLGFPTANLACPGAMIPDDGVYAARCEIDGKKYPVALSIGTMPTFEANQHQIEAHLIGFDGNLYGREITLQLIDWIRQQRKFPKIDLLKQQLNADLLQAHKMFTLEPAKTIANC